MEGESHEDVCEAIHECDGAPVPLGTPLVIYSDDANPKSTSSDLFEKQEPCLPILHELGSPPPPQCGGGGDQGGALLCNLADELQAVLLSKLTAPELIILSKTCKRVRRIVMDGEISQALWEQVPPLQKQSHPSEKLPSDSAPLPPTAFPIRLSMQFERL